MSCLACQSSRWFRCAEILFVLLGDWSAEILVSIFGTGGVQQSSVDVVRRCFPVRPCSSA